MDGRGQEEMRSPLGRFLIQLRIAPLARLSTSQVLFAYKLYDIMLPPIQRTMG